MKEGLGSIQAKEQAMTSMSKILEKVMSVVLKN
jgi:hypothetical protein